MNIEIRRLEPADFGNGFFETLNALRQTGLTPVEACHILSARPDNIRTFVLVFDGSIAATATLIVEQKFIHRGGVVGHVEDIATRPDRQGKGLARMLIDRLIDEARREGCYKVILDCETEVEQFYERLGFRRGGGCMRIDL